MNLVYMGTPPFAVPALKALCGSRHRVLAVVTGPDKPIGRGRKLQPTAVRAAAEELSLPALAPPSLRDAALVEELREIGAELFVVIAFRILPEALFSLPPRGSINIHASLLPKYRGAAPIQRALMNGESETGLSAFLLERTVDTGAVISQVTEQILPEDTYTTLAARLGELAGGFLVSVVDRIESGEITPVEQDESQASPAPKIKAEDHRINWAWPAGRIANHIRALADSPGAVTAWRGKKIKVLGASVETDSGVGLAPGEALINGRRILIGAGDGSVIKALKLKPEGKKALSAIDMINGELIVSGEKLGEGT
ncbi:MAG: methionyl-tRNA formyltransferase [Candidatus Zixiibacteriota bacterium]